MKITFPDGTSIEGPKEELEEYLPPVPQRNWDGSLKMTRAATEERTSLDSVVPRIKPVGLRDWT